MKNPQASTLHLLRPMSLEVDIYRCLLTNDPSLAKVKINANLPQIYLSLVGMFGLHFYNIIRFYIDRLFSLLIYLNLIIEIFSR